MSELDAKINQHFGGLVVRKDLVGQLKANAVVPNYVLEYLLGQACATNDEAVIAKGLHSVKAILQRHYVHRSEAELVRSKIREKGAYKVIDRITVTLNEKHDVYEASFANLGLKEVLIDADTVQRNQKLLVGGVWCIVDMSYFRSEDKSVNPFLIEKLKPIQLSRFDFGAYVAARQQFTTDEWIDVLMQSVGLEPELFGRRAKLLQLARMIPFCENNYNFIELGPKGTGKSYIFGEFSPHGMLLSGGEVTPAKLFVNNATGRIGLVGYWDCVAFDEFAGKQKRAPKALVDIMKNYMANKSFSRGIETLPADASMAFVGNTRHSVPHMLKNSDLFDELPAAYHDSAFLDRIHFYLPGWEVGIIRSEMFSHGYGFVVDYLAEILRHLRPIDYTDMMREFTLSSSISTRDKTAIRKTFSGLMKLIYPGRNATEGEREAILRFAIEGRKRVKDQIMRIDATFEPVAFTYEDGGGRTQTVQTLEEKTYPQLYHRRSGQSSESEKAGRGEAEAKDVVVSDDVGDVNAAVLTEKNIIIEENQRGISFDDLFGAYVRDATHITLTDPYIRVFHQARNLMELLETITRFRETGEDVAFHLITTVDYSGMREEQQKEYLEKIEQAAGTVGIQFTWEIDNDIHARHIITDHGWKITLDRGLDIYQRYEMNDTFSFENRLQPFRACRHSDLLYTRIKE